MPRGRPCAGDAPATSFLYLRVTARQLADLHDVARDNRLTLSEVIREAVFEWAADRAERQRASVHLLRRGDQPVNQ